MYKKAVGFLALSYLAAAAGLFCVTGIFADQNAAIEAFHRNEEDGWEEEGKSSVLGLLYLTASDQRVVKYGVLGEEGVAGEPAAAVSLTVGENLPEASGSEVEVPVPAIETIQEAADLAGEPAVDAASLDEELAAGAGLTVGESPLYQLGDEDYELLLRIVEAEAGSEDEDGRLMVANVVFNRMNSEEFPDTVSDVVLQTSHGVAQFSPVSSGRIWDVTVSDTTVSAVERALKGEDLSQGALYFAARRYADRKSMKWFDEELTFLFRHGGHEFFS